MRIIGNDPNTPRQTQVVASGTLSTGDTIVVNADGTVSAVAETSTAVSSSMGGSRYDFNSASTLRPDVTFITDTKFVVVYTDVGNSNYPTARVGTISGTTISYGSETVLVSTSADYVVAAKIGDAKVAVSYRRTTSDNDMYSVAATISGTSLTVGSAVKFDDLASGLYTSTASLGTDKFAICWRNGDNFMRSIIGTVSGTTITFGSSYEALNEGMDEVMLDSNGSDTIYLNGRDENNFGRGTVKVGTVSGTVITWGSVNVYGGSNDFNSDIAYIGNDKVMVVWQDFDNSSYGKARVGTVSGTSVSWGSEATFHSNSTADSRIEYVGGDKVVISFIESFSSSGVRLLEATISGTTPTFSSLQTAFGGGDVDALRSAASTNSRLVVMVAEDQFAGSQDGFAQVYQAAYTNVTNNLTSENYIGTAKSGAADGDGVVVNTQGKVDDNQTGLTAGQSYYVRTDGTLSTTAGSPKLIVKG
jgi:hypothetical protein